MNSWIMLKKIFLRFCLSFFLIFISQNVFSDEVIGKAIVVDGDTLKINKKKIRLFGIDAPEIKQICKKNYFSFLYFKFQKNYKCGLVSQQKLKILIKGNNIKCISNGKDKYKRFLSICFVKKKDINAWLVKSGYAIAYKKYSKKYISDEKYARRNKLGLWSGSFQEPEKWRKNN